MRTHPPAVQHVNGSLDGPAAARPRCCHHRGRGPCEAGGQGKEEEAARERGTAETSLRSVSKGRPPGTLETGTAEEEAEAVLTEVVAAAAVTEAVAAPAMCSSWFFYRAPTPPPPFFLRHFFLSCCIHFFFFIDSTNVAIAVTAVAIFFILVVMFCLCRCADLFFLTFGRRLFGGHEQ